MIKWIRYYLPLYVKHLLAPRNEFGIQKILGQFTNVLGIDKTPPTILGKIPKDPRNFFPSAYLCEFGNFGKLVILGILVILVNPVILMNLVILVNLVVLVIMVNLLVLVN